MISEIKELLKGTTGLNETVQGEFPEEKLILAIAVLLLETAGADNDYAPEEVKTCFRSLEKLFGITDTQALDYLEQAEIARNDKEKVNELVFSLNENFSEEQRCIILSLVWKIIAADQKIEKHELRIANQIRVRLQLSDDQNEEARKLAFNSGI